MRTPISFMVEPKSAWGFTLKAGPLRMQGGHKGMPTCPYFLPWWCLVRGAWGFTLKAYNIIRGYNHTGEGRWTVKLRHR